MRLFVLASLLLFGLSSPALAWDSDEGNPTHATHTYMIEWALEGLPEDSEARQYAEALVAGANQECHELETGDDEREVAERYGVDLEARRLEHGGTNEGCQDPGGWWRDARQAWLEGEKARAWFYLGVYLHMVQDMGVPAHANSVHHQAPTPDEPLIFDNLELVALMNWKPDPGLVDREDPLLPPEGYYGFAREWTRQHAPDYDEESRDEFGKNRHRIYHVLPASWKTSSDEERALVARQQACSAAVSRWVLQSALAEFSGYKGR